MGMGLCGDGWDGVKVCGDGDKKFVPVQVYILDIVISRLNSQHKQTAIHQDV